MVSVVTKKVPSVVLVDKRELKGSDLLRLIGVHGVDLSDFVICMHRRDEIYVNQSLKYAKDIAPLISKIMEQRHLNTRTEKLLGEFAEIAGEKASDELLYIRRDWRKERMEAETKEQAEEIVRQIRKKRIRSHVKPKRKLIKAVFGIGFGLYEEGAQCDHEKGAEYAFLYGYLCGLEKGEESR